MSTGLNKTPPVEGSSEWLVGVEMLARRAYPGLRYSMMCSRHQNSGHFDCTICYPDRRAQLKEHMEVSNKLYEELLALTGLSDPLNGRIGTNAIIAELRRKLAR